MKMKIHEFKALFIFASFLLTSINGFSLENEKEGELSRVDSSKETETAETILPIKRNLFADISYSILGVTSSNVFLNYVNRLANASFANMTFQDIWGNIVSDPDWMWEDGDRFHVNQLGHGYLGATYYASARVNGFNFYQSMPAALLGAVMWEVLFEPEPAYNDVISTTISGVTFGEMLFRLFLEADTSASFGAVIGGFFLSPTSSHNKIYNRPAFERGGGKIYSLKLSAGAEKTFAYFPENNKHENSWKYPGGFIYADTVYGDPFLQQSKKPYDHFEMFAGFSMNNASYNAVIISDGYLFSINPVDTGKKTTSTGLSMHFDIFNSSNDFKNNEGVGNINFSSNAIGWTLKHIYHFTEKSHLEIKTHINAILWGTSTYNNKENNIELWGSPFDALCTFGFGENIKLSFSLAHKKAGRLDLSMYGYHIFAMPFPSDSPEGSRSKGNVFFLYGSLNYDLPFTEKVGIGVKETYRELFGKYDTVGEIDRRLLTTCFYVWFKFK